MKKMPCLFVRKFHGPRDFTLTEQVTPGCEWVLAGEGVATRKWDGTACMLKDGVLFKRYDAKKDRKTGEYRLPPPGAISCGEPDPVTGHWPHWIPVGDEPESKWHREAWDASGYCNAFLPDGTYELCGPAINGNPESLATHCFFRHGDKVLAEHSGLRSFGELRRFLEGTLWEGIVFHHPDGRMCKIRRHDFGFPWGSK
jgi:hypothetical protein